MDTLQMQMSRDAGGGKAFGVFPGYKLLLLQGKISLIHISVSETGIRNLRNERYMEYL